MASSSFLSDGVSIAFDLIGPEQGRPVLLIHGFASSRAEMWQRLGWYGVFERKGYRLIALDLRGHGDSGKPHDPAAYGREALTGDLVALLDHIAVKRADVLGYSMGARLALALAAAHPGRVDHLVAGGAGARLFEPVTAPGAMAAAMLASDPDMISEPMLRSFRHFADEQGADRMALAAFSQAPGDGLTRERLEMIAAPALIAAGARDQLAGDPAVLAGAIPGARSLIIPGCDHFSAIPHGLFKASVMDFFDDMLDL